MSNYSQLTDFSAKDDLVSGDPEKLAKGADIDAEFDAISVAIASKEDTSNKNAASGYAGLNSSGRIGAAERGIYSVSLRPGIMPVPNGGGYGWLLEKLSTGQYKVNHNLTINGTSYRVMMNFANSGTAGFMSVDKQLNHFTVHIKNTSEIYMDTDVDVMLVVGDS